MILNDSNSIVYSYNPKTFISYPGTTHEVIPVSEEQWSNFRRGLDEARVWTWRSDYIDLDIFDGKSWSLVMQYADGSVETRGRNAYPQGEQFARFLQAVRELRGGKDFR